MADASLCLRPSSLSRYEVNTWDEGDTDVDEEAEGAGDAQLT